MPPIILRNGAARRRSAIVVQPEIVPDLMGHHLRDISLRREVVVKNKRRGALQAVLLSENPHVRHARRPAGVRQRPPRRIARVGDQRPQRRGRPGRRLLRRHIHVEGRVVLRHARPDREDRRLLALAKRRRVAVRIVRPAHVARHPELAVPLRLAHRVPVEIQIDHMRRARPAVPDRRRRDLHRPCGHLRRHASRGCLRRRPRHLRHARIQAHVERHARAAHAHRLRIGHRKRPPRQPLQRPLLHLRRQPLQRLTQRRASRNISQPQRRAPEHHRRHLVHLCDRRRAHHLRGRRLGPIRRHRRRGCLRARQGGRCHAWPPPHDGSDRQHHKSDNECDPAKRHGKTRPGRTPGDCAP